MGAAKTGQHVDDDMGSHGAEFRSLLHLAWHRYYTTHGIDCVISDPAPFLLSLRGPQRLEFGEAKL